MIKILFCLLCYCAGCGTDDCTVSFEHTLVNHSHNKGNFLFPYSKMSQIRGPNKSVRHILKADRVTSTGEIYIIHTLPQSFSGTDISEIKILWKNTLSPTSVHAPTVYMNISHVWEQYDAELQSHQRNCCATEITWQVTLHMRSKCARWNTELNNWMAASADCSVQHQQQSPLETEYVWGHTHTRTQTHM